MSYEYVVVDLETSIKNRGEEAVGNFRASPFHPDNRIVMQGWKAAEGESKILYGFPPTHCDGAESIGPKLVNTDLLVGQNIGFDLLYLYRNPEWREWAKTGRIWDTMIVEFLLTGHLSKYASLDKLALKYGGTTKPDKIKEYWEDGVDTEDIPKDELDAYLISDLENTEIVFLGQLEEANRLGMLPLIHTQMEARMATIEMEWNGMYFDADGARMHSKALEEENEVLLGEIQDKMKAVTVVPFEWNPSSNQHLSAFFFGGRVPFSINVPQFDDFGKPILYKSGAKKGEVKYKKTNRFAVIPPILDGDTYSEKGASMYSTGVGVLKKIAKDPRIDGRVSEIASDLLKYRKLSKDVNAYYTGYPDLTWPTDKCIHPSYNHTATGTGRLSCSNPNLQQVSNSNE